MTELAKSQDRGPIFVHASVRSGSTYFFNVLRRTGSLLCFNEAINDRFSNGKKHLIRVRDDFVRRVARGQLPRVHTFLKQDGKAEFIGAWDDVMALYPQAPVFRDYVPRDGVLSRELSAYLAALIHYASVNGKRAALCEVFSRGRAGALRDAFGGFHIAQFRDPLCQFGSSFRTLQEIGGVTFVITPLLELGVSGNNPLYLLIPEPWRVPTLPWPADDQAQRWATTQEYLSRIISSEPGTIERVFRWHLLSWFLNNIAAIVHSDFVLDIDKAFDDPAYRKTVREVFRSELGTAPDFSDIANFPRYYHFEGLDIGRVCSEVTDFILTAHKNGTFDAALTCLGRRTPDVSSSVAIELLRAKLDSALVSASTNQPHYVGMADWDEIVQRYRRPWTDPHLRQIIQSIFPFVFPLVRATRRIRDML